MQESKERRDSLGWARRIMSECLEHNRGQAQEVVTAIGNGTSMERMNRVRALAASSLQ